MITNKENLKAFIRKLQKKIESDEEKTYSPKVIREYRNPTNFGSIDHPDATGLINGPCGDTMKIMLTITKNVVEDARFWTDGCGATLACGNMLTSVIKKKNLEDILKISSDQLIQMLDGLPKENQHCATLAVNVLHQSIDNFYTGRLTQDKKKGMNPQGGTF